MHLLMNFWEVSLTTKVKVNLSGAVKDVEKWRSSAQKIVADRLPDEIIRNISAGVSPVRGKKFKKYSDSYKDAIRSGVYSKDGKARSPVNLKLTGKLHESIFIDIRGNKIIVGFKNALADIHNRLGAGKSKTVRRMLPTEKGEQFNKSITLSIREFLETAASKIFR
jgi:phage gpG-like protein